MFPKKKREKRDKQTGQISGVILDMRVGIGIGIGMGMRELAVEQSMSSVQSFWTRRVGVAFISLLLG